MQRHDGDVLRARESETFWCNTVPTRGSVSAAPRHQRDEEIGGSSVYDGPLVLTIAWFDGK